MSNSRYNDAAAKLLAGEEVDLIANDLLPATLRVAFSRMQSGLVALGFASFKHLVIVGGKASLQDQPLTPVSLTSQVSRELIAGRSVVMESPSEKELHRIRRNLSDMGYKLIQDIETGRLTATRKDAQRFKILE